MSPLAAITLTGLAIAMLTTARLAHLEYRSGHQQSGPWYLTSAVTASFLLGVLTCSSAS